MFEGKPDDIPWDDYFALAAKQKETDSVKKFVDPILANEKTSADTKLEIAERYFEYLLMADLHDDAIAVLRSQLLAAPDKVIKEQNSYSTDKKIEYAVKLHFFGDLLKKPEFQKEGLETAKKRFQALIDNNDVNGVSNSFDLLFDALLKSKHYAEAEQMAIDTLSALRLQNLEDGRSDRLALPAAYWTGGDLRSDGSA